MALHKPLTAVVPESGEGVDAHFAPVFLIEDSARAFNRIGLPTAKIDGGEKERIFIDPDRPAIFVEQSTFATEKGSYRNLIYRVHFERVPLWNLTSGRNVGLFVIITLDADDRPLLVTTVHTCGCYLAIVPTEHLPLEARPAGWKRGMQEVHGERLPRLLVWGDPLARRRLVVSLRTEVHRVMALAMIGADDLPEDVEKRTAPLQAMSRLEALPTSRGATSFFTPRGLSKGYVKGSWKPFEMLLMGWLAADFFVGRDKKLGPVEEVGTRIYTSIKPWRHDDTDLHRFGRMLRYWGWRL
jgi:hypothetical protein